jgi:hypothetical protein
MLATAVVTLDILATAEDSLGFLPVFYREQKLVFGFPRMIATANDSLGFLNMLATANDSLGFPPTLSTAEDNLGLLAP